MKTCTLCKQTKPLADFYKDRSTKDRFFCWCKECKNKKVKEYRQSQHGRKIVQEYMRSRPVKEKRKCYIKEYDKTLQGKKQNAKHRRTYKKKYPERIKARRRVQSAIFREEIPKASTLECAICSQQAEEYHHNLGYGKEHELDIIPLCTKCHRKIH